MAARKQEKTTPLVECINEVRLIGRVSAVPESRELPSGDVVVAVRVVVTRSDDASRRRQSVDALECAVWSPRLRRSVLCWREGDMVEVAGALRRRFFRAGGGAQSRVEVEVSRARVIRRSASG